MSQVVLVGAGHVHLGLFAHLSQITDLGHQVTVISGSADYCYSGMAPGVLGGRYDSTDISLDIRAIVEKAGVRFLPYKVVDINPSRRLLTLENGSVEEYDLVSFNIGSHIPLEGMELNPDLAVPAKPIINFLEIKNRAETFFSEGRELRVIVAGGGPAGLEISANLAHLARERNGNLDITLISAGPFMSMLPVRARRSCRTELEEAGVHIMEGYRLKSAQGETARIEAGPDRFEELHANLVILATGVEPEPLFRNSGLPVTPDGALLVNEYLQCPNHPEIFGGGDCVGPPIGQFPRIGVVACRQNPVITRNLKAALGNSRLSRFRPRRNYLQIFNLGNRKGLVIWNRLWFKGTPGFILKDAIDRRFIRRLRDSLGS